MTPENRARMRNVLRESLQRAYLPGTHPHRHDHSPDAASAATASTSTFAGTPAVSLTPGDPEALATRFCQEFEALAGMTYRADSADAVADHVASILAQSKTTTNAIVSWSMEDIGVPGLGEALTARGISIVPAEVPFADPERGERLGTLAALAVGLTGAQTAIAESGSLVLVSGPGRGRLSSLLPPVHIAIVHRACILPTVSDVFRTYPHMAADGSNIVIITGPSRTADIEMTLSRGVHGPGEVHAILV
jgi:L-lactate dehydrogenase complex protein LldG